MLDRGSVIFKYEEVRDDLERLRLAGMAPDMQNAVIPGVVPPDPDWAIA
ncbi:hypothetical protein OKW98_14315 [Pseudomonas sp. KU26590]|nr:hypothetical protein [Pseudomonas sp. KU26590]UZJ57802.1 hypothetical protein OKW98_14315 [Pseudomonas sp. KU26590]